MNERDRDWLQELADDGVMEAKRILAHLIYLEQEAYRAQERENMLTLELHRKEAA